MQNSYESRIQSIDSGVERIVLSWIELLFYHVHIRQCLELQILYNYFIDIPIAHWVCTSMHCCMAKIVNDIHWRFWTVHGPIPGLPMLIVPSRVARTLLGSRSIPALMAPLFLGGPRCLAILLHLVQPRHLQERQSCVQWKPFPWGCTSTKLTHDEPQHHLGFKYELVVPMTSTQQYAAHSCFQ